LLYFYRYTNIIAVIAIIVAVKGKVVPVLNEAPRHEGVLGVEVYLHAFFDLGIRWR
jgi:hypothetical protein